MLHVTGKDFQIEVKQSKLPVVVMFYAVWCGKCAMMKPIAEEAEEKYKGRIKFCEVNVDQCEALAAEYEADIIPTFLMFQNGEIISGMQGVIDETVFEERIGELLR